MANGALAAGTPLLYPLSGQRADAGREFRGVDLASEPDFELGNLRVSPSTREIFAPSGRELLEPRVMMVLTALAAAGGHTVSREALIDRCWDGLIVGDDAINRVIGRLRKLAAASGAFEIETITKVGYRLRESGAVRPSGAGQVEAAPAPPRKALLWPLLIVATIATLLIAAGLVWRSREEAARAEPGDMAAAELIENGRRAIQEHTPERQDQGIAMLREAVVLSPRSAEAWGALALGYVHTLTRHPHDRQPEVERQAEAAAARALALDPQEPMALAARARMLPLYGHWLQRERAELDALQAADGALKDDFRGRFLLMTGRMGEVLTIAERSAKEDPSALYPRVNRVQALWALGRVDEADRESQAMLRLFPGNYLAWFHRFYFLLYSGRLAEARAMADDRANWPVGIPPSEFEHARRMVDAVADPGSRAARDLLSEYDRLVPEGRGYMENAIRISAALGQTDRAFRQIETYLLTPDDELPDQRFPGQRNYGRPSDRLTELLFIPPVDRLHGDPRFLRLLARAGLVEYWRKSGTRPDFCNRLEVACRAAGIPPESRSVSAS